jgi:molecular chaperone IbpA
MTTALSIFNKIRPVSIGLDSMFDQIDSMFDRELTNLVPAFTASNYPPYNIVKVDENRYEVYVALAGISKEDIKVYKDGNSLVIRAYRNAISNVRLRWLMTLPLRAPN